MRAEPRTHRLTRLSAAAAAALAVLLTASACSSAAGGRASDNPATAAPPSSTPSSAPLPQRYVALGDSFTAAPFVPTTSLADGCLRSDGNYPSLVATALEVPALVDVSCSGADTVDLTEAQQVAGGQASVPPQLDALTEDTALVTLGIGGNDRKVFGTVVRSCSRVSARYGTPCLDAIRERWGNPEAVIRGVARRVERALDEIAVRAPTARRVLVGYPRIVSSGRACSAFPLTPADRRGVTRLERLMRDTFATAARTAGADFVDMYAASRGHAVCDPDPWVNGARTDQQRALAFHPFAVEQQQVADRIEALLRAG